jgi:radical SAM protein with 4Fe4S-binding SPASM domain
MNVSQRLKPHFKKIYIEIGNTCNLQCTFCPEVSREKKQMSLEEFEYMIPKVLPYSDRFTLHLMGEPLLHPQFSSLLKIAHQYSMPIELTTNGTKISQYSVPLFIESSIVQINFSLHSFFDNFPQASIEHYLNHIFHFTNEILEKRPDLYINYRLWNHPSLFLTQSIREQSPSVQFNMKIIQLLESFFEKKLSMPDHIQRKKRIPIIKNLSLHFDTQFQWPHPDHPTIHERGTCQAMRQQMAIHADGTVVPCCLDKEANINLGNIFKDDLEDIFYSSRGQDLLQGFLQGFLVESLCQKCSYRERFKKFPSNGPLKMKNL